MFAPMKGVSAPSGGLYVLQKKEAKSRVSRRESHKSGTERPSSCRADELGETSRKSCLIDRIIAWTVLVKVTYLTGCH